MSHQDVTISKEAMMEPQVAKTESCGKIKIVIGLLVSMLLIASVAFMVVYVTTEDDDDYDQVQTSAPSTTMPEMRKTFVPDANCGPFYLVVAPSGVMNVTYELGRSFPGNTSAIRISASTTSSGWAAVGFRNLTSAAIGHMFGIDVIAFDRTGVYDRVITTQPGPPAGAPPPSIVTMDQLVVGNLIYARFFRDLATNSSFDMSLHKGMQLNVAYALGVGNVGTTWQHHMFQGSQNTTLYWC